MKGAVERGATEAELLAGIDLPMGALTDPNGWLDWDTYHRLFANAHQCLGDDGIIDIGRRSFDGPVWSYGILGVQLLWTQVELWKWACAGPIAKMYPCGVFEVRSAGPHDCTLEITVREGLEPSYPLALAFKGQVHAIAKMFGHEGVEVAVTEIGRGHRLTSALRNRRSWYARASGYFHSRGAQRAAAEEMGRVHAQLTEQLRALEKEVRERKAAQAALTLEIAEREALAKQVEQTRRLRSVALLAGGVAHDFNNILLIIQTSTEMALMDLDAGGASGEARKSLGEVLSATDRAAKMTAKLLTAGRRQVIEPREIDLDKTIGDMRGLLGQLVAKERIHLEIIPGAQNAVIRADPDQIEQMLLNLCINARDASESGGKITIETSVLEIDADYVATNPWAREGNFAVMRVSDQGVGMSSEVRHQIFDPFFTTKPQGSGTGLGMSVVMGVVKQHEGLINVYSEVGVGTTMVVYLPLIPGALVQAQDEREFEGPAPSGHETLLLVDDEESVRELSATVLTSAGYDVISVSSGDAALELLSDAQNRVDLVVLDVVMPGLSGPEVAERARKLRPELRILYTSGYSPRGIHDGFALAPDVDYLPKPYGGQELLWRVRRGLDRVVK